MTGSIGRLAVKLIRSTAGLGVVASLGLFALTPAPPAQAATIRVSRASLLHGSDLVSRGFVRARTENLSSNDAEDFACVRVAQQSAGFVNLTSRSYQGAHTMAYETVIQFRSATTAHRYVAHYVRGVEACPKRLARYGIKYQVSRTHHPHAGGSETVSWTVRDQAQGERVNQSTGVMRSGSRVAVLRLTSQTNKPWRAVDVSGLRCDAMWRLDR